MTQRVHPVHPPLSRRSAARLATGAVAVASAATAFSFPLSGETTASEASPIPNAEFPRQDPAIVQEVVGASHFDFARVKELVTARPTLALATWDWGFGDWETALGAASHMGRVDIAQLLMEHGARPDLFTHAMLGHLDVVRAAVAASPGIQQLHGPHGIPLLQHAIATTKAKDAPAEVVARAKETAAYLESLGDAGKGNPSLEVTLEQMESYLGDYRFGVDPKQVLHVTKNRQGRLTIAAEGQGSRMLHRVEEHAFAPPGAPQVRIRFTMENGQAVRLTVHDPQPVVVANRI